jgi:predicted ArsR family transcriptional regulator
MKRHESGLPAVSSLAEPVRARVYQVVSESAGPIGRDEAASAAGIGRPLAAYHLDKLVELGLLTAAYRRPADRGGPGAGRPAKVYALSGREFAVSVPPRDYELAARLLATAVQSDGGGACRSSLLQAAGDFGFDLGARSRDHGQKEDSRHIMQALLRDYGYEPAVVEPGSLQLRNCPFHQLVALHRDLVCGMNLALLAGVAAGVSAAGLHAELDPAPGRCCVVIKPDRLADDAFQEAAS